MKYTEGTVTITGGQDVVTGKDTSWAGAVKVGDMFTLEWFMIPVQVSEVIDDTHLRLARPIPDLPLYTYTGQNYSIASDFTAEFQMPYPNRGDIDTAELINRSLWIIDDNLPS
jgi:hypothetical protein